MTMRATPGLADAPAARGGAGSGAAPPATRMRPVRLGVVSFVNALPLVDGLENLVDVELRHTVPSLLVDQLGAGEVDVALASSIDYQRSPPHAPLRIVPVGLLGCDGPTLTVRLFSTRPPAEITRVFCDIDSHTSIALLRIVLKEVHGVEPELIDYDARDRLSIAEAPAIGDPVADNRPVDWPEAMLLIGDKVVADSPPAIRYPHQLDLGAAWVELTGLPFVFALWMARADADEAVVRTAAAVLDRQRRHNLERIDRMIHQRARPRGWPVDLAQDYLKRHIAYEVTAERIKGLELFFEKAASHGLIEDLRPLQFIGSDEDAGIWDTDATSQA